MRTKTFGKNFRSLLSISVLGLAVSLAACTNKVTIDLQPVGDTMAFSKTKLQVKAGAEVTLNFSNIAKSPAMIHNFVLCQPGTDAEVSTAGLQAGADNDFLPEGNPNVIAHTKLLKPGEKDTIEFKAPEKPGDYPFICTFPGHYPMMKGVMTVN